MAWNEIAMTGNPTGSRPILDLINAMQKMEAARLSVPSQARRAFWAKEFGQVVELLTAQSGQSGIWLAACIAFQLSMVARIDDTASSEHLIFSPFMPFQRLWHYRSILLDKKLS